MSVSILGALSLGWFFVLMMASVRFWIPQRVLTLQAMLFIGSLILLAAAVAFGVQVHAPTLLTTTTLNPITATIAGFVLAGAVEAGGGFAAAAALLVHMARGFFGLPGTVILLVNSPTIFAMPCGRIWAAALTPAALMFGFELARRNRKPQLVPIITFGLIANAAASCGPSPLGGIGMMGEGMAGFLSGSFVGPQQLSIMIITLVTMAAIGFRQGTELDPGILASSRSDERDLAKTAYFSFLFYVVGLIAVFVFKPPVPVQTILLGMTLVIMIVARVGLNDLMAGVILHPLAAMIAGFIMAGALVITGAFDTLVIVLSWVAQNTPLGIVGMTVLLIYLPLIFPMPCGRVMVAALLPGVIMFGQKVVEITNFPAAFAALLVGFILCCAASCAASPLGGIGAIGEGNLGLKEGSSSKPCQLGILLGVPVAALIVTLFGLSTDMDPFTEAALSIGFGLFFGAGTNVLLREPVYRLGGLAGGLLVAGLMVVM